ncbi:MAG: hypothetical protein ACR2QK_13455 [Acidimicrobiales bacterium]
METMFWRYRYSRLVAVAAAIGLGLLLTACGDEPDIADATARGVDRTGTLASATADPVADDGAETEEDQQGQATVSGPGSGQEGTSPPIEGPGEIAEDGTIRAEITGAGDRQTFRIEVVEGQEITMAQLGGCAFSGGDRLEAEIEGGGISVRWLFRSEREGDCSDIRRFEITRTETIVVVVEAAAGHENATGAYSFQVTDVTTPGPVAIDGNVAVSADSPTAGAGRIEGVGHQDRYSFQAVAGEVYVLRQLDCDLVGGDFLVMEVEGAGLSSSLTLRGPTECSAVERLLPTENGTVELLVRANGDETTGTYSFVVEGRGADAGLAELVLGDAANPDATPIIAGELSEIGEQDTYSFDISIGQQFLVQQTGDCEIVGDDAIWADVTGPGFDDTIQFKTLLDGDCRVNSWYEADNDGRVDILVRHRDDAATGTYNFRLLWVPVDPILTLSSGQVVAPHSPVAGAGILSALGQQDVYRIDVVDDETVTIELLGGCDFKGNDRIFLDAEGAGLNELMFVDEESEGDCLKSESHEIERTGPLFITVSDRNDNLATGSYSFVVTVE